MHETPAPCAARRIASGSSLPQIAGAAAPAPKRPDAGLRNLLLARLGTGLLGLALLLAFAGEDAGAQGAQKVMMDTTHGQLGIELYPDKAPETVANFLEYAEAGFYDGLIFHRVIPGFVIQGGGFQPGMQKRETSPPIQNEADNGLRNLRYTLSMARTGDPHSATSQFFINLADNAFLDKAGSQDGWGYAVFGKVVSGQEAVDRIAAVQTGNVGRFQDVPLEDVVIERAWVE